MALVPAIDDFPDYLSEGAPIALHHSTYGTILATVVRPFRPRTVSHIVLARITEAPKQCPLSKDLLFVIKVFDARFIHHRSTDCITWNPEAERRGWEIYQRNPVTDASDPDYDWPSHGDKDEGIPPDEDHVWEEFYFREMASEFSRERAAYMRLSHLHGTGVPKFYGDGVLDLSSTTPARTHNPPVVLLEYISDAVTLHDVDPLLLTETSMRSMLDLADRINDSGVLLTDINPGNFMFAPAERPTRAIALDFADAVVRDPTEDDQSWAESVSLQGARHTVKRWLRQRYEQMGLPVPAIVQRQED